MRKKILIIRFSSIGDIVLTSPVVRALARQTGAEIHFLTKPAYAALVEANPYIDKVHLLHDNIDEMIQALKQERFDHLVDLHHNLRTLRIKLALGVPSTSFNKLNIEKWFYVRWHINRLPDVHIVDRYLKTVSHLGVLPDGDGLDYFIPNDCQVDVVAQYGLEPGKYVAVILGAAHQTKCLTATQIADVCRQLDVPVVLLGGRSEVEKGIAVCQELPGRKVMNTAGTLDLHQSASVLNQSGGILSHDTGLMHIAAALGKPQVVVWGNTVPAFGMYPYYGNRQIQHYSFEVPNLSCRPCSKLGFEACPKGHFKCILNQDLNGIANQLKSILEEKEKPNKTTSFNSIG